MRVPCAFDPRYKELAPAITIRVADQAVTGALTDIGVGGVGFMLTTELEKHSEVEVAFKLQIQDEEPFQVAARGIVRHCVPSGRVGTYRAGLEFTAIDKEEQAKLAAYVASFL